MPKRKAAPTKLSGLIGSDDDEDDVMQFSGTDGPEEQQRPVKRQRGRPRSSGSMVADTAPDAAPKSKSRSIATVPPEVPVAPDEAAPKPARRGRPKGSRNSTELRTTDATGGMITSVAEDAPANDDPHTASADDAGKTAETTRRPPVGARGRKRGNAGKPTQMDGEFEYTPSGARQVRTADIQNGPSGPTTQGRRTARSVDREPVLDSDAVTPEVDETVVAGDSMPTPSASGSPIKHGRVAGPSRRSLHESPRKQNGGAMDRMHGDPELRRKLGDMTKKYDTLETRYRNLKQIGIIEANANMDKLKKHCETISAASNELVASLRAELEGQRALSAQTRSLQKQLKDKDAEIARLESHAQDVSAQLAAAHAEVTALQTKLAAARNTAASIETVASKAPGSAVKGSATSRAHAAAAAEAAHAAQYAQLKEDLYGDLTGLIIRDVKKRDSDHVYDCLQTGINGTLHFKLAVPQVSAANYESAEFHYIPLLDESRDRELINLLPDYLTVDITFARQQASKFYMRVIDTLTKRRAD